MKNEIYNELCKIPMLDAHTHIDASHMCARGLHDILLYHMVISDLYSAGCPEGSRLSEEPGEAEIEQRIKSALPYIKHIQNTSCFWGMKTILCDLYDWEEDITEENWRKIDAVIRAKSEQKWAKEILGKTNIKRVSTELWRGHGGLHDEVFQYSLEWAFFTRNQWNTYDTALLELEHAWNQDIPGAPLGVTADKESLNFKKKIKDIDDVAEAVRHYCEKIPYEKIISTASHLSTDITYAPVTREQMVEALKNRAGAGEIERDIYANYINELYYKALSEKSAKIVLNYSIGAEPLPYESGSKLRTETVFELAGLIDKYKNLNFSFYLSSQHQNQALCTLARELPNVSLTAYWWHNFFPWSIRQLISQRLDMLPANKQVGFFSDAYCVDWVYAKAMIVRKQLAEVLAEKIAQGQYSFESALATAKQIVYETPRQLCYMEPSDF
ncbi:MAG: hypothetical protein FWG34_07945 [Oscillospiraceae bacterium]|nr:hypothetical protein [Oscillospiraceae bacterium]